MPSQKHRRRAKRRATKLVEQALEAADDDQLHLADKLIQRALVAGPANARFWLESARVAAKRGQQRRAERALLRALALSPGYAEAQALLDDIAGAASSPPPAALLGLTTALDDDTHV